MSSPMKFYNSIELELILKNPKTDFNNFYKVELVQMLEIARKLLQEKKDE